jgi:hypothetical protein
LEVEHLQKLLDHERQRNAELIEERHALQHETDVIKDTLKKERDEIMEKISRLEMIEHQQEALSSQFEEQKMKRMRNESIDPEADINEVQNAYGNVVLL